MPSVNLPLAALAIAAGIGAGATSGAANSVLAALTLVFATALVLLNLLLAFSHRP